MNDMSFARLHATIIATLRHMEKSFTIMVCFNISFWLSNVRQLIAICVYLSIPCISAYMPRHFTMAGT